jgi:hypothetical protein
VVDSGGFSAVYYDRCTHIFSDLEQALSRGAIFQSPDYQAWQNNLFHVLRIIARRRHHYRFASTRQFRFANDKLGDDTMNKTSKRIAVSIASVLIAASMIQAATAGERTTKHHFMAPTNEQVRNANAWAAPSYADADELARLRNGAESAPAGH